MKKKIMILLILIMLFIVGLFGFHYSEELQEIYHDNTSQPENAPFRHM